jgi:regulator of ribonuclease activity A
MIHFSDPFADCVGVGGSAAMPIAVTDLSDAHPDAAVCHPLLRRFGGVDRFCGPIRTLQVFEDNALVRAALEQPGQGSVLVVDGGGSLRCALLGGQLGVLAVANGWTGVVVNGCVRDVDELAALPLGVLALAAHPRRSEKGRFGGRVDVPLTFAGARFDPGAWLYADADGVLVSARRLHAD